MIILKFGGTSVSNVQGLRAISKIVKREQKNKPIVVVSALSGVTDMLVELSFANLRSYKHIIQAIKIKHYMLIQSLQLTTFDKKELTLYIDSQLEQLYDNLVNKRYKHHMERQDRCASCGEILSSRIVDAYLRVHGFSTQQVLANRLIYTTPVFGNAEYLRIDTKKSIKQTLLPLVVRGIIPIVTGYIGSTRNGKITTLGRGGSDYSAAIIGSCIGVSEVQIWTDVDGILTTDPSIVPTAKTIKIIPISLAKLFAKYGAKVLHPKTILPAVVKNVPITVRNTFNTNGNFSGIKRCVVASDKKTRVWGITKMSHNAHVLVSLIGESLDANNFIQDMQMFLYARGYHTHVRRHTACVCQLVVEDSEANAIVGKLHSKYIQTI